MKKRTKFNEMLASGDVFGSGYESGDYAPGDARIPKVLGPIITRRGKIKQKRKKTLFDSFFNSSFETEPVIEVDNTYVLTVTKKNFERIIEGIIRDNTMQYDTARMDDGSIQFRFYTENENIYAIQSRLTGLFNDNIGKSIYLHLEQTAKLNEDKEFIPGGEAQNMDARALAKKHKEPLHKVRTSLSRGRRIEYEHTPNPGKAREIAKDHIEELGYKYYPALDRMEKKLKALKNKK